MALTLDDYLAKHPITPEEQELVEAAEARIAEVRAYRLRELRERAGLTQAELARRVGTVRRCVQAVGGGLAVEFVTGDARPRVESLLRPARGRWSPWTGCAAHDPSVDLDVEATRPIDDMGYGFGIDLIDQGA